MDGFWAALRRDVTSRTDGVRLELAPGEGGDGLEGCKPVLDACY
jgi:hypothetical protein